MQTLTEHSGLNTGTIGPYQGLVDTLTIPTFSKEYISALTSYNQPCNANSIRKATYGWIIFHINSMLGSLCPNGLVSYD